MAAEVLRDHVVLEVEAIDRMYSMSTSRHLQSVEAVVGYLGSSRGRRCLDDGGDADDGSVRSQRRFELVNNKGVDLVFQKGAAQRRRCSQKYVRKFTPGVEGVLYVGKARRRRGSCARSGAAVEQTAEPIRG